MIAVRCILFGLAEGQRVMHFMGEPEDTCHRVVSDNER
jgi:5-keto 4-deoxyuronate isomerase